MKTSHLPLLLLATLAFAINESVAIDARLMRYPDVSESRIAFVYAGDIWAAPKQGGEAVRLSSPRGEETFPKFSPDGKTLAFSANYDGNTDVYTVPVTGGVPTRLTYHGAADRVLDWYPDGQSILFASGRYSERDRYNKLFKIAKDGGFPEQLSLPYGEMGDLSPDQSRIAYTPISIDFRTWKRYRGGMTADIWLFDLNNKSARNLTQNSANDSFPMWSGPTLFFLSDRDSQSRHNLWSLDTRTGNTRQITQFKDADVQFPSKGPQDIVFTVGDRLWLLDLKTQKSRPVDFSVVTDGASLKPRRMNVADYIQGYDVSPSGRRMVLAGRGDVYTVPKEFGVTRNLTRSSGVAERWPTWSPDGKQIAYFTDRSGEYQLAVRSEDGTGEQTILTQLEPGFRYRPQWSPDSKKIAFVDFAMRLWLYDFENKTNAQIDKQRWLYEGELAGFRVSWSPDSRWLAYAGDLESGRTAIVLYDTKEAKRHQVTSGYYDDSQPVFDPEGKYLFFRSGRTFEPLYSDLDETWIYPNTRNLMVVALRRDVPSLLAPRNDEEKETKSDGTKKDESKKDTESAKADKKDESKSDSKKDTDDKADSKKEDRADEKKIEPVHIDLADFERRAEKLPIKAGNYDDLAALKGKLIYRWLGRAGAEESTPIDYYDFEKRETKRIVEAADDFILAAKGETLLVRKDKDFFLIEPKEKQSLGKRISTDGLEMVIEPMAEWRQLFTDAWRIERDFFYDPNMHGVEWQAVREHYGRLIEQCVTRWDVNFVIGEMIAELNASHTYRSGGDLEVPTEIKVGYLGCDFALTNGAYQISGILDGGAWDSEVRSPLRQPAVTNVQAGDYLLAVNGIPLNPNQEPWAVFQGLNGATVQLTVNRRPSLDGATNIFVKTLDSELRLRNLAWIEANRARVAAASDGKVGYIYVPNTARDGQSELVRQYQGQFTLPGLIIDERFNSGGQVPDRFIELIGRKPENYWSVRHGQDWQSPPNAHNGAMAMLINAWSGSGGDCFPYYFKKAGLGPLIGTRTWGGLIGITGSPGLIDNGGVTAPAFAIYDLEGKWIIESEGVAPDIEVVDDPAAFAQGRDPQLERAIAEVLKELRAHPPLKVVRPKYPNRSGK
jgi:tricorn protease